MSAYLSDRRRGQAQSVDQVPELKRDPGQENPFRKKESRSSWKIRMYMTFEVCWIAIVALGLCTSWSPLSQGKKRKKTEKGKGKSIMSLIESPSFLLIPVSFPYILNHFQRVTRARRFASPSFPSRTLRISVSTMITQPLNLVVWIQESPYFWCLVRGGM